MYIYDSNLVLILFVQVLLVHGSLYINLLAVDFFIYLYIIFSRRFFLRYIEEKTRLVGL